MIKRHSSEYSSLWSYQDIQITACYKRNWLTLHWRPNDHDGVSNHQPHGCLLNRLFRRRSKQTSKLRLTGICVENSPGPVNSPHKGPVTRKMFPFDDVIMRNRREQLTHRYLVKPYGDMDLGQIVAQAKACYHRPITWSNVDVSWKFFVAFNWEQFTRNAVELHPSHMLGNYTLIVTAPRDSTNTKRICSQYILPNWGILRGNTYRSSLIRRPAIIWKNENSVHSCIYASSDQDYSCTTLSSTGISRQITLVFLSWIDPEVGWHEINKQWRMGSRLASRQI